MNLGQPPIKAPFADNVPFIGRIWTTWFNDVYNRLKELFTINNELILKTYKQDAEPTLTIGALAMWVDTDDSERVYLLYKLNESTQKKVELI